MTPNNCADLAMTLSNPKSAKGSDLKTCLCGFS